MLLKTSTQHNIYAYNNHENNDKDDMLTSAWLNYTFTKLVFSKAFRKGVAIVIPIFPFDHDYDMFVNQYNQ